MARPKKIVDQEVEVSDMAIPTEEPIETTVDTVSFPYTVQLETTSEVITVVEEREDAQGRKLLVSDTGCTYHAE